MSNYSFCQGCGSGMKRITYKELSDYYLYNIPISCNICDTDRYDNTKQERIEIMVNQLNEINDRLDKLEGISRD